MLRTLVNIDPLAEFQQLSKMMDRAFGVQESSIDNASYALPIDIYERDNNFYIRAAVPGVDPGDLDISVENNVLTIRGETRQEWENTSDTKVYRREYRYGSFSRSIHLPEQLELDKIDAEFKNGFVTITIPRAEAAKPKALKVNVRHAETAKPLTQEAEQAKAEKR
jgi:HSP20 family protein